MPKKNSKKSNPGPSVDAIVMALVALLVGWALGYVIGNGVSDDDMTEADVAKSHSTHAHDLYEVPEAGAPSVEIVADADAKGGWNVTIVTQNFEFTPQNVNGEHVDGQGHAHIYVDGEKIARVYGNNYHLPELGEGDHELMVTLNTNMHDDYAVNGERIMATLSVTEEASDGEKHSHDDDDGHSHDDGDHSHSN